MRLYVVRSSCLQRLNKAIKPFALSLSLGVVQTKPQNALFLLEGLFRDAQVNRVGPKTEQVTAHRISTELRGNVLGTPKSLYYNTKEPWGRIAVIF